MSTCCFLRFSLFVLFLSILNAGALPVFKWLTTALALIAAETSSGASESKSLGQRLCEENWKLEYKRMWNQQREFEGLRKRAVVAESKLKACEANLNVYIDQARQNYDWLKGRTDSYEGCKSQLANKSFRYDASMKKLKRGRKHCYNKLENCRKVKGLKSRKPKGR